MFVIIAVLARLVCLGFVLYWVITTDLVSLAVVALACIIIRFIYLK